MSEILALQLIGIIAGGIFLGAWAFAITFVIIDIIMDPRIKFKWSKRK